MMGNNKGLSVLIMIAAFLCCCPFLENASFIKDGDGIIDDYDCLSWNSTMYLKNDSNMRTLKMFFKPFQEYKRCFRYYKVQLYLLQFDHSDYCDVYHGIIHSSTTVDAGEEMSVAYTDVRNGNYCFLVQPCSLRCFGSWSLHSNVVSIHDDRRSERRRPLLEREAALTVPEILAFSILILASVSGILAFRQHKSRKRLKTFELPDSERKGEENFTFLEPQDIFVYILYTCDESTRKLVAPLREFLKSCAGFNVVTIEEELPKIYVNPNGWIREVLDYRCTKGKGGCDSNKRFIIVKTESVTRFLKYDVNTAITSKRIKSKESTSCDRLSEGEEDDHWFYYALNSIFIDWSKCFQDYCHLFVVCFDDALCYDELLFMCPCVRYTIPDQLVDLCIDLSGRSKDKILRERLKQELEEYPVRQKRLEKGEGALVMKQ